MVNQIAKIQISNEFFSQNPFINFYYLTEIFIINALLRHKISKVLFEISLMS